MTMTTWFITHDGKPAMIVPDAVTLAPEAEADILLAYHIAAHRGRKGVEISGIGHMTQEKNSFYISDSIIIPQQTCSSAHTRWLGEEGRHVDETLIREGKNPEEYHFWWHSHVFGEAYFSAIDTSMIRGHLKVMLGNIHHKIYKQAGTIPDETTAGPFLALVGTVWQKMKACVNFIHRQEDEHGEHLRIYTCDIPIRRPLQDDPELKKRLFEERHPMMEELIESRLHIFKEIKGPFRDR